ncbi:hypothetical protein C4J95_0721 [Pseudomonas orientalis]|uniref:hypothetical protein n=1 Tax=Pseudomonas orientalis TaxID=76758 RepID=UPI000F58A114|nr:hypothetical protein [Pseudomonas orientalis]AZE98205.1 hypothetical protein C4J95_0721 [Pseudomonas orientalis]
MSNPIGNPFQSFGGGVDNTTTKVISDQLMREKNAQNLKQTKDGIDVEYSTKVMQQIGQAKA